MLATLLLGAAVFTLAVADGDINGHCGMPLVIPPEQRANKGNIDPVRNTGIWYEYLYITPGVDDINARDNYQLQGCYNDYGVTKAAVDWSLRYYFVQMPDQPCVGIDGVMNITSDARKEAHGFTLGVEFFLTLYILYTDYEFMEFYVACQNPPNSNVANMKPTDICPQPSMWVRTRYPPSQLTDAQKAQIKATVDPILKNYCYSIDILQSEKRMFPTAVNLTKNPVFCTDDMMKVFPLPAALAGVLASNDNAASCSGNVPTAATLAPTVATTVATTAATTAAPSSVAPVTASTAAPVPVTTAYASTAAPVVTTAATTAAPTVASSSVAPATATPAPAVSVTTAAPAPTTTALPPSGAYGK